MLAATECCLSEKHAYAIMDILISPQAANYLDIKGLLDILCRTVAETIRGKDPEQIRRTFHASDPSNIQPYPPPHAQQDTEQDTQAHQQPRETEV